MMRTCQSPTEEARNRYVNSFSSRIFDPPPQQQGGASVPAGKRRDQTTSEMWGNDNDKDLRAMPETFIPRDDARTARQKKLAFLSSDVLPMQERADMMPSPMMAGYPGPMSSRSGAYTDVEEDAPDPVMRRQQELHSELFGRSTPAQEPAAAHSPGNRLTPTDFKWFNLPEGVHSPTEGPGVTYQDRSYHEKCSGLFNRTSPPEQPAQQDSRWEQETEMKRKANVYYSDLFGRQTPMTDIPGEHVNHPRHQCPVEEQIVVNQDWTDSKTELMRGTYRSVDESAADRRHDEFDKSHLFNYQSAVDHGRQGPLTPIITDNSEKLSSALGQGSQRIHQAHLQSSLMAKDFYENAEAPAAWEVVELHVNGLPYNADDGYVKKLCQGFDLQIVKVSVEMDPVRNLCKGRAKLMLRYNPQRDNAGLNSLIESLQSRGNLTVQM